MVTDSFGNSVSISGDVIVIGAGGQDEGDKILKENAGAVYIIY